MAKMPSVTLPTSSLSSITTDWDPITNSSDKESASHQCLLRIKRDMMSIYNEPPPGLFVVPDEKDMTIIHALITGSFDTPYEGGFFYFLIRCPSDYPIRPPRVKLMTTGAGTVRFNPNLYKCGKICLSILGKCGSIGMNVRGRCRDASASCSPSTCLVFCAKLHHGVAGEHRDSTPLPPFVLRCVFVMQNSTDIKENQHHLDFASHLPHFLRLWRSGCFHCDECLFGTHDSSPVITVFRNPGSVLAVSRRSCATSRRRSFCSGTTTWARISQPLGSCSNHHAKLHVQNLYSLQPLRQSPARSNDDLPSPNFAPSQQQLHSEHTWTGPSWSPAQSLSSVLISIQSLLNEKPYHNEPGFERERCPGDIGRYNDIIQHETLRVAVCGMLENETCLAVPDALREVMEKTFLEFYDYYESTVRKKLHLHGQHMQFMVMEPSLIATDEFGHEAFWILAVALKEITAHILALLSVCCSQGLGDPPGRHLSHLKDPFGEERGTFQYRNVLTRLQALHEKLSAKCNNPGVTGDKTTSDNECSSDDSDIDQPEEPPAGAVNS
ncbi:hypothetical protein ANN_01755 [Periplaneta americana]|uniref:Ubiquitin-conjugating enzyme E2 Z n=1 Tax=Periplaneta americana TaxID=6978 RepID=A0ABQ8TXF7_PERAM|nr:hypothetical protein ANN_01755 [Periplaneta americana]